MLHVCIETRWVGLKEMKLSAYHCQGIAEEDESGGMVGQVFGYLVEGGVRGLVLILVNLVGRLIDQVCSVRQVPVISIGIEFEQRVCRVVSSRVVIAAALDVHTDDCLRLAGAGRRQPELAQVLLGLAGDVVEP